MQIFLDTADIGELKRWLQHGIVDGATTNPSIMLKAGVTDIEERARELSQLLSPRPLSVEVTSNDVDEMILQGRTFARWGSNIVVKIPVINESGAPCLSVVNALEGEGIAVNVTACLSFAQAMLAAK